MCQALAPPAGLVELSRFPASSAATQSVTAGQEMLEHRRVPVDVCDTPCLAAAGGVCRGQDVAVELAARNAKRR